MPKNRLIRLLLDPLEEKLHLPAAFAERADGGGRKGEVVGDEHQRLAGVGILEADAAQVFGIAPLGLEIVWSQMMPFNRSLGAE